MTSQLNVDTIVDKAGSGGTNIKVGNDATYVAEGGSANSNNLVQGLAKCWHVGVADGTSLQDSFNVASMTDQASGRQIINLTNSMNNADYNIQVTPGTNKSEPFFTTVATGSYRSYIFDEGANDYVDAINASLAHGDLA